MNVSFLINGLEVILMFYLDNLHNCEFVRSFIVCFVDGMSQQYFTKLYSEYESVCQDCLDEVERIKVLLVHLV